MVENKYAWDFAKRLIYEAIEVAEEDGTYFDRREILQFVQKVCEQARNGYSSMYQDLQKGVKTEIDALETNDEQKAAIKEYILPKMLVGGFTTVTIASVVFADIIVPMIF